MDKERDDRLAPLQPGHLTRHQRGLVEFGLALSRKDIKKSEGLEEFKEKILEALELLKNDRMQDAAFKIDDAMMLLPPERRISRVGVAEWARKWWRGHLDSLGYLGGVVPARNRRNVLAAKPYCAACGALGPIEDTEQAGFARTIGAEQTVEPPRMQAEAHAVQ